jgi:UDP-3-O-[3-hydroxymyristoyl] glucosamine N-acyltransferase|tara:strand:- start:10866 stop:11873 length:1008 start_codon:yes stop_codon:yes gene_type:complete
LPDDSLTLGELASRFGCELIGDHEIRVNKVSTLQDADHGSISFLANPVYRPLLNQTKASAVILTREDQQSSPCASLICEDPYLVFTRISSLLDYSKSFPPERHPAAFIHEVANVPESCNVQAGAFIAEGVNLGESVYIGANSVIEKNARIGDNSWVAPNVTVMNDCVIGNRAVIHPGVVIGGDGYGFSENKDHAWEKIPQVGAVIIGDDVEIGANTTIDRGALSNTVIGNGVKLDNQIMIAHNVVIGDHTAIVASTSIAGSSKIGKFCRISGQVGITGHVEIADHTTLTARTSVMKSISKAGIYSSNLFPHQKIKDWQKNVAKFRRLKKSEKSDD